MQRVLRLKRFQERRLRKANQTGPLITFVITKCNAMLLIVGRRAFLCSRIDRLNGMTRARRFISCILAFCAALLAPGAHLRLERCWIVSETLRWPLVDDSQVIIDRYRASRRRLAVRCSREKLAEFERELISDAHCAAW